MILQTLKNLLTKDDGESYDPLVVGTFVMMLTACGLSAWRTLYIGDAFDAYGFLIGCGALVAAAGVGQRMRDGTPPPGGRSPPVTPP